MMKRALVVIAALGLAACGGGEQPAPEALPAGEYAVGYGPDPELPAPQQSATPTVNFAKSLGWSGEGAPVAPEGFTVTRFAEELDHPRWLYLLPNGDVLVAESRDAPQRRGGFMTWARNFVMRSAGAIGGASANRITLLRDADGDGVVDTRTVFKDGLNMPIGMALVGDQFFVANTDSLMRFAYTEGATSLEGEGELVMPLPFRAEGNGHWTRNVEASPDGTRLYVSVGSVGNINDHGMEVEEGRAAIWEVAPDGSGARVFASGIRNPVGLDFEPVSGVLWTSVNERDMLGDNLVPDYMTSVREGAFYGWPYSYYGQNVDERVQPQNADLVASAVAPDYALGAHTASLGLHFYRGAAFPEAYRGGAFVGQHGSWNRSRRAGYKVIYVPFADGRPAGPPQDFLTGFVNRSGRAMGRPVSVIEDRTGALLVADDVGDIVWRVAPQ